MSALEQADVCLPKALACKALGIPRATWYRHRAAAVAETAASVTPERAGAPSAAQVPADSHPQKQSLPARAKVRAANSDGAKATDSERALTPFERQQVLEALHSERFQDLAAREVWATLLDEGTYLCSIRTMYRLLAGQSQLKERRKQAVHPAYARPELLACRPNELWSWDITKLRGPFKGSYFQLYVILDVFSRYVVGWMLAHAESAELAQEFIEQTLCKQGIAPGALTLHADRGSSMRSQPVASLLDNLGVTKSHSRPHVSDDNPYSESAFKTLKYCPQFPDRFGCIEEARAFCRGFFAWYNQEHHHVGLALLTPYIVHYGQAEAVISRRQETLAQAYASHPCRFRRGLPQHPRLPDAVWINAPLPVDVCGSSSELSGAVPSGQEGGSQKTQ